MTTNALHCDVCGETATVGVNDLMEMRRTQGWRNYRIMRQNLFCEAHYRESRTVKGRLAILADAKENTWTRN